ncbi:renin receptor-like [Uloborus diversus]|uniref:renin receptor-like n=1 Tax=Uloborus diversus TaxID=327109 RepID=UPI00240A6A9E|nr:renin receptor-like [Uloborus diversus]
MAFKGSKHFLSIIFLTGILGCVYSVEEVVVVHAPDSVKFLSSEPIRSSSLGDIFSAMLAYTTRSKVEWHSMAAVTPWKRPEALAILEILGFDNNIDLPLDGSKFLLENVGDIAGQFDLPAHRSEERYFGKNGIMLHMHTGDELHESKIVQPVLLKSLPADPEKRLQLAMIDSELGQLIKDSTFNISVPSDVKLLTELATVKEFLKALSTHKSVVHDNIPDIYWLKLEGFENIVSTYGSNSFQFREGLRLLRQIISEFERVLRNTYDDNVVVVVIKENNIPLSLSHRARKLLEATTEAPDVRTNPYNLATKWDPMFPVTFMLMVFIGIVLTLSVLGISVAMWNMDPGRDSIIYRMTSQRMKKD